jgi:hypothetical protein
MRLLQSRALPLGDPALNEEPRSVAEPVVDVNRRETRGAVNPVWSCELGLLLFDARSFRVEERPSVAGAKAIRLTGNGLCRVSRF